MARDENPPFLRGQTYYNGLPINANDLGGTNYEGKEYEFEDLDYSVPGSKPSRTNRLVRCRIVRNVSGMTLYPGQLVRFKKSAGVPITGQVDGLTSVTAEDFAGVVDEWLSPNGVPNNDLFFIVVAGPTAVLTPMEGANSVFNVGDVVVAHTAVTSGATTAGRVVKQDLSGATANLANQIQNRVGVAMSAATTGNTNSPLLVNVYRRW